MLPAAVTPAAPASTGGDVTGHVVFSVVLVGVLIAGLAFFLVVLTLQLTKIADKLEAADGLVAQINADAETIVPSLEHAERTGDTIAHALPLLYDFAERIVKGVSPNEKRPEVARPAMGSRRSRMHEAIGYAPK